jgi:iron complex outermembrane receptor protein
VINVTSQTGTQPPTVEASSYYGSFGTWHYGMKATGAVGDGSHAGDVDYTVSTNRFTTMAIAITAARAKIWRTPNWGCASTTSVS